jgi:hypothetical protein
MATRAEKVLKTQKMAAADGNAQIAAIKYVNQGLKDLGLKPAEKVALQQKLIPIVKNRIQLDRGRTASRVQNVVTRQAKERIKKATEGM